MTLSSSRFAVALMVAVVLAPLSLAATTTVKKPVVAAKKPAVAVKKPTVVAKKPVTPPAPATPPAQAPAWVPAFLAGGEATTTSPASAAFLAKNKAEQSEILLKELDPLVAKEPKNAKWLALRASAKKHGGNHTGALEDYSKAIALAPYDATLLNDRGNTYKALKQWDAAMKDYNDCLALTPNDALALFNRGDAYSLQKQPQLAVADFSRAIALKPQWAQAYAYRAFAYKALGGYTSLAVKDLNKALELETSPTKKSVLLTEKVIMSEPEPTALPYVRQVMLLGLLKDSEQAIRWDATNAKAYFVSAQILGQLGRKQEALFRLATAKQLQLEQGLTSEYQESLTMEGYLK
jgi:tetratricopeptide (TPR) repeat protein